MVVSTRNCVTEIEGFYLSSTMFLFLPSIDQTHHKHQDIGSEQEEDQSSHDNSDDGCRTSNVITGRLWTVSVTHS